jgi:E3 ubiquitin-protein ligase ATL6/9/15/31/42/55
MPSSSPRPGAAGHVLLAALLASALVARGQDGGGDAPGAQDQDQISRAMVALLAAVVAVFVFIASATAAAGRRRPATAARPPATAAPSPPRGRRGRGGSSRVGAPHAGSTPGPSRSSPP